MNPFFSVVVPTIGRESLMTVLNALHRQTIDRSAFEVIVVSDGVKLTALSLEAAELLGATVIESPFRKGPGAARNIGAGVALGEWIVFTEDDVQPDNNWLTAASDEIRKSDIDVLEGRTLLPDGTAARHGAAAEGRCHPARAREQLRAVPGAAGHQLALTGRAVQ